MVSAEQLPRLEDKDYPVQMSFIGGFDAASIGSIELDTSFLFLVYPIRKHFDDLAKRFGSADYQPGTQPIQEVKAG